MTKQTALGANLYLGIYDLSGDVGAVGSISSPRSVLNMTAINAKALERTLGMRDGKMAFSGFWNTAAGQIFDALSAMPTTDVLSTLVIPTGSSLAIGDPGCAINGKQISFDPQSGQDGSLAVTTEIQSNGSALEWGRLLTAGAASVATGTVNQTGIDDAAQTTFGWAAYLHVFAMASGTMAVKLQESADNGTYTDLAGGAFTSVTGATSQRIAGSVSATVKRYIRLNTSGTHATATMAVLFVRYQSSQAV